MLPVPFARRCVLTSAVGPDVSGSNPGIECVQMPERSGIDGEPFGCAYIGDAAVDTNVTNRRKFRCREFMLSSPFRAAPNMSQKRCYTLRARASKTKRLALMLKARPAPDSQFSGGRRWVRHAESAIGDP